MQLDSAADYHLGVTWIWAAIMLPHHKVINDPVAGLELTTFEIHEGYSGRDGPPDSADDLSKWVFFTPKIVISTPQMWRTNEKSFN